MLGAVALIRVELPAILPTVCFCTVAVSVNKVKYVKLHVYY